MIKWTSTLLSNVWCGHTCLRMVGRLLHPGLLIIRVLHPGLRAVVCVVNGGLIDRFLLSKRFRCDWSRQGCLVFKLKVLLFARGLVVCIRHSSLLWGQLLAQACLVLLVSEPHCIVLIFLVVVDSVTTHLKRHRARVFIQLCS